MEAMIIGIVATSRTEMEQYVPQGHVSGILLSLGGGPVPFLNLSLLSELSQNGRVSRKWVDQKDP